jgi:hypothetical protein
LAHILASAEGVTYRCQGPGALLSLPHDADREEVVRTKAFEDYIRDNVVSWFNWSKDQKLPVDAMEDLILVTGCTLVDSWAAVAFLGRSGSAEISLVEQSFYGSDRSFECSNIQGDVIQHCTYFDFVRFPSPRPTCSQCTDFFFFMPYRKNTSTKTLPVNQCVFIKGFRATRRFFRIKALRAAAEPLPDDPDSCGDDPDEIQVTQVPDGPKVSGLPMVRWLKNEV